MAPYNHKINTHKRSRFARKLKKVSLIVLVLAICATLFVVADWILNNISQSDTEVSRITTSSVQSASITAYRTKYFQFQAPEEWVRVSEEDSEDKYVFIKNNGPLVTERLIVFVDRPLHNNEADMPFTHVLPVKKIGNGRLEAIGKTSDHCSESVIQAKLPANSRVVHAGVEFVCNSGSKQYNVIVGELESNELLQFNTLNAKDVTLTLAYSNLSAYPGSGDLYRIVETFEAL